MVQHLVSKGMLSERRACGLVRLSRSVARYVSCRTGDEDLRKRLRALAERYPRYGYLMLHALLKTEGLVTNAKKTYRLYREEGLQVRTKKRKKLPRQPRVPLDVPTARNQRWSLDFVSDQLANGRRFRVLNIVNDFSAGSVQGRSLTSRSLGQGWPGSSTNWRDSMAFRERSFWITARS